MHYSQKRRYYFFIAIVKFKTVLSYYPPLAQASATHFGKLSEFAKVNRPPPMLILRSTFAQPSLNLRSTFAYPSLILRSRFAQPSLKVRSRFPRWRKLAACAQFKIQNFLPLPLILRSTFAQGSLILLPLAGASLQLVPNSKFKIFSPRRLSFAQGSMRRILNFELGRELAFGIFFL